MIFDTDPGTIYSSLPQHDSTGTNVFLKRVTCSHGGLQHHSRHPIQSMPILLEIKWISSFSSLRTVTVFHRVLNCTANIYFSPFCDSDELKRITGRPLAWSQRRARSTFHGRHDGADTSLLLGSYWLFDCWVVSQWIWASGDIETQEQSLGRKWEGYRNKLLPYNLNNGFG